VGYNQNIKPKQKSRPVPDAGKADDVGAKTHHENQLIREEMVKIKTK